MNRMKSLVTASIVALMGLSLTACNDSEIAFGAGVVVGVIVSDNDHHHHHRPNPPRYRGRHRYAMDNLSRLTPQERVAVKYNLSLEQSDVLVSHLLRAQAGDLQAMAELGFEKQDLVAVFEGRNPSASTLQTLSEKLNLEISQSHELIQDIKADAIIARESMM